MTFSFLRVPVQSFEKGPLFWPRVALFWLQIAQNWEKAYFYIKNSIAIKYSSEQLHTDIIHDEIFIFNVPKTTFPNFGLEWPFLG